MKLAVLYPRYSIYDKANEFVPFSGGAGRLVQHRTLDTIPDLSYEVFPFEKYQSLPASLHSFDKILVLGEEWLTRLNYPGHLNKLRGYCLSALGKPMIATYSPMDCWMFKPDDDTDENDVKPGQEKDVSGTRRANYLFWCLADFQKLINPPTRILRYTPITPCPSIDWVIKWIMSSPADAVFSLDIETRRADHCLDCIGLGLINKASSSCTVVSIPIYHYDDSLALSKPDTAKLYKALTWLLLNRLIVGHNLSFDLSVLTHFYHLPIPAAIHDTMLFMHRHHPLVEKSLHHAISYYTNSPATHKADIRPNINSAFEAELLSYNSKDVYWTAEVYMRQLHLTKTTRPDLLPVIEAANQAQRTTLIMSFTGITVDGELLSQTKTELQQKAEALGRVLRILTNNAELNPSSPDQWRQYFYMQLNYNPPYFTAAEEPALDEKALLMLHLAQPNPIIPILIEYRGAAKALSALNFTPYNPHSSAL